ncbi:MAG TPA: VOC family protein [Geothrix sp.]|nr:VOC family protein [Geothrix sp.]
MQPPSGTFIWYELNTGNSAAAQAFYGQVLGLSATPFADDGGYTLLSTPAGQVGGVMALPDNACDQHAKAGWVGYIGVEDVDATAQRIRAAGGTLLRDPWDIPGVGRLAVAADPHGAVFLLIRGATEAPKPKVPAGTAGHIGWHELHAGEGQAAFAFYSALFGWTKDQAVDMGPLGVYQTFCTGEGPADGGMMTRMPDTPHPFWLYYFNVAALDPAIERVKRGGGQVLMGPHEVPGGRWIAQCVDPEGALFALLAPHC